MSVARQDQVATELPCLANPPVLRLVAPTEPPRWACLLLDAGAAAEEVALALREHGAVALMVEGDAAGDAAATPAAIVEEQKRILHGFALAHRLFPRLPLVVIAAGPTLSSVRALLRAERATTSAVIGVVDAAQAPQPVVAAVLAAAAP